MIKIKEYVRVEPVVGEMDPTFLLILASVIITLESFAAAQHYIKKTLSLI